MKIKSIIAFLIFIFSAQACLAITPKLADVEISNSAADSWQIILALTAPVKYKVALLSNPERLMVDLYKTDITADLDNITADSLIKKIRTNTDLETGTSRLVLELNQKIKYKDSLQKTKNSKAVILTLDLTTLDKAPNKTSKTEEPKTQETPEAAIIEAPPVKAGEVPEAKVTVPQKNESRDIIIIVDPGHGGHDPGAIGPDYTQEKNVNLAISRYLAKIINQTPGYKAVLTRDSDYFIPLRGRLKIARNNHADMFVAVHADFYKDPKARGATVFALSISGATSEAARYLAQKENESELGHFIADKDQTLQSVLINLTQSASLTSSLEIGGYIMQNLNDITKLHHHKVEQAAFVVLKEPEIPSLLVETGFISNAEEEQLLKNPIYQQQIAAAIATGIETYFAKKPPLGTALAAKKN